MTYLNILIRKDNWKKNALNKFPEILKLYKFLAAESKIIQKEIDFRKISKLKDEQVIEELTEIKGIGNWTAQIYLMFCLERKDVFPVGDLGIQKGIRDLFSLKELPNPKTMEKYSARWKPNRSIACWYIWKSQRINSIG